MIKLKPLLFLPLMILLLSCKNDQEDAYAIKDFRKSLQPFLQKIISKGFVTYYDSAEIKSITDDELIHLSRSENPILRATAFEEILDRVTFDHFNIVMDHLDDTAIVAIDHGEFGIAFDYVSDHILQRAYWENPKTKNKTVEAVLTKHNYLRSAYTILYDRELQLHEAYYPFVKDMATRPRRLDDGYELGFGDIEYALYGLARFRKKGDASVIKAQLMEHVWRLSDVSFHLMEKFPDTAYLDVLQEYHDRRFYHFSGNRPHGFTGIVADRAAPEDFIRALVVQQNDRSANLLDTMLINMGKYTCMPDKENIIRAIMEEIWEHPCPAYVVLRERIRPKAEKIFKNRVIIPMDTDPTPVDTTKRKYRW